jgi:hypothetical protein
MPAPKDVQEILRSAACPSSLFQDDYRQFLKERSALLEIIANEAVEKGTVSCESRNSDHHA